MDCDGIPHPSPGRLTRARLWHKDGVPTVGGGVRFACKDGRAPYIFSRGQPPGGGVRLPCKEGAASARGYHHNKLPCRCCNPIRNQAEQEGTPNTLYACLLPVRSRPWAGHQPFGGRMDQNGAIWTKNYSVRLVLDMLSHSQVRGYFLAGV